MSCHHENVNEILQKIYSLPLEEQTFISETINKRIHELRRMEILERAKEAKKNFELGNVTHGSVEDLIMFTKE